MTGSAALVVALACCAAAAGCSSAPVKEQARTAAIYKTAGAPQVQPPPIAAAQLAETPRVAVDPLNEPAGLLAKRSVYYDYDESGIKDQDKPLLQAHAGYLAGHRAAKIRIEGNCDERGSREYNLALGERRAEGVKDALKLLGAADTQITIVSWGEEKPKAPGHDEAAWAEDRRSDIVYESTRK
ncbi:MAG: peptidoglycan-associated lipoprotein Pal [Burkholderiales bacterium]